MKFNNLLKLLVVCLVIFNLSEARSKHKRFRNRDSPTDFDLTYDEPVTNQWNFKMAREYRNMAALGYVHKAESDIQMKVINRGKSLENQIAYKKIKDNRIPKVVEHFRHDTGGDIPVKKSKNLSLLFYNLFYVQGWSLIETVSYHEDQYKTVDFTVIKHYQKKKIVVTFAGSKTTKELISQAWHSGGLPYPRVSGSNIQVMKYYMELYESQVRAKLEVLLARALKGVKDNDGYQVIFAGHSKGGALATLAAFDSVVSGFVKRTENSPCLITYGQPRTGNFVFANEVSKAIPIIFRHVNQWDMVTNVPACFVDAANNCINEYDQPTLNESLTVYTLASDNKSLKPEPKLFQVVTNNNNSPASASKSLASLGNGVSTYVKSNPAEGDKYYPWHIRGLVLFKPDKRPEVCNLGEVRRNNPSEERCKWESSTYPVYHTHYLGYQVSRMHSANHYPAERTANLAPDYLLPQPLNYNLGMKDRALDSVALATLKGTGHIVHKKKKFRKYRKY